MGFKIKDKIVEVLGGRDDTHYGMGFGQPDDPFYRIHITPQGQILRGPGNAPPLPVEEITDFVSQSAKTGAQRKVFGDGQSKPLSNYYGTLGAAQAAYPHAKALTDELDWAIAQAAADTGYGRLLYVGDLITNRPIKPANNQRHIAIGGATIKNTASWVVSPDAYEASAFELGNLHPEIFNLNDAGYRWQAVALNPISAGDQTITVTTPANVTQPLAAGDVVAIRADNLAPTTTWSYDFVHWNRVVSWNAATGVLVLELPVPVSIVATATSTVLGGPKLCINAGFDRARNSAWWFAQSVTITGFKIRALSPTGTRSAGWRCKLSDLEVDCQYGLLSQAMVLSSHTNIWGFFGDRAIEVKLTCQDAVWRDIDLTYRAANAVTLRPAISVGEQSYGLFFDNVNVELGKDYNGAFRAVEFWCQHTKFRGTIRHYGSGGHDAIWAIKSTLHPARPPMDISLDLVCRSRVGMTRYGIIGHDAAAGVVGGVSADPVRVDLILNQRGESAGGFACRIQRGSFIQARAISGDTVRFETISPGQFAERGKYLFTTIAGPVTYAANSETLVAANIAMAGVQIGDKVDVGLQRIGTLDAGVFGDLLATVTVAAANLVTLYIRNRSATAVTVGTSGIWVYASYERNRV
ncbi:MAG TPA: hypothetical protein VGW38_09290 [Chloroflexota bacterium]|nr:hypothetical protein [Chloroflexota bacterium]